MPYLVGLPGVKKKKLEAVFFQKPSQASRLLRTHRGLTSASDNGAISVWIDDSGQYRAAFHRRFETLAEWCGKKKTRLTEWLNEWMPRMELGSYMAVYLKENESHDDIQR